MTTSVLAQSIVSALHAAVAAEVGLIVRTNDVLRAKAAFYRFRRELAEPEFKFIQIRISPVNPETDLWLIRLSRPDADAVDIPTAQPPAEIW